MVLVAGGFDNNDMLPRAPNCTTRRAGPGLPQAASTPHALVTRRRCYQTAWSLLQGDLTAMAMRSASAELYDPASGTWTATGSLNTARDFHTATLLQNGMVLVAGGFDSNGNDSASAELYDPASGTWTATGSLNTARDSHTATLLQNGMVLVAGGSVSTASFRERRTVRPGERDLDCHRQPQHRTRFSHGDVATKRHGPCCRGIDSRHASASAELYDPASGTWTATGSLNTARYSHTATLLQNGMVLVAGGFDSSNGNYFRERRTVRPGERDLDCHRQPQHRTRCSHGDVATKRHGPCCRGSWTEFTMSTRARNWDTVTAKIQLGRIKEATFSQLKSTVSAARLILFSLGA